MDQKAILQQKKLYLLDMDGTLYLGMNLFPWTKEFLQYIKESGGRYMFLTNNSSKGVDSYVQKMKQLGIDAKASDFFTSVDATICYLKPKKYHKIYALGTASFREQLKENGFPITDHVEEDIDCLCMGYDTELTYQKLIDASLLLNRDIDYIATNPDWVCPTEFGYVPDCGSIAEALYNATKKRPQFIGKPQPEMIELAIEKAGYQKEDAIIFGDRLYTDIKSGNNANITTCFVLSGEGTLEDLKTSDAKPDFVFNHIGAYLDFIR